MSDAFKVSLSISKKSDGSQLFYKIDGERFKENKTIKLHVDTVYKVTIDVRPPLDISTVSLSGINVDGTATKTDSQSSFSGTWSSGMVQKTSNKVRTFLPLHVQFGDGSSIQISLQSKLYNLKDKTHVVWGTPLKCIELKCSRRDGINSVSIDDVNFM
ncbi:CB1 cannabinoid receptor-interacting protein 1-like [Dendronephthya gigantea]|uniref:CB1 cannabinoid receptor-interacting protein 1-like n=1 Tax=Dendronephthya gigantea TaxID=151771 RepID=UPI00106C440D|nr:CB1 cannabinoid receptor-interacting protein 1-like [Dendronephthya gigantea]